MKLSTKRLLARFSKKQPLPTSSIPYLDMLAEGRIDWPKNKKTQRRRVRNKIARASRRR